MTRSEYRDTDRNRSWNTSRTRSHSSWVMPQGQIYLSSGHGNTCHQPHLLSSGHATSCHQCSLIPCHLLMLLNLYMSPVLYPLSSGHVTELKILKMAPVVHLSYTLSVLSCYVSLHRHISVLCHLVMLCVTTRILVPGHARHPVK